MVTTYPLRQGFFKIPDVKKRRRPTESQLRNKAGQSVTHDEKKVQAVRYSFSRKVIFGSGTPADDAYHLGHMIYTL